MGMAADLLADDDPQAAPTRRRPSEYVVVARRYRPQNFEELIGQKTVSQGLANAIVTNRVGHAYLFTGARGVGKTSTARIFAKALNCVEGPTTSPCGVCDICQGIASGEDVDVLEIDGASNRGIDEIRQLRQNVNIRPSRARFKIYIIDEVHMLTTAAFNALLKTLEEPPEHVKFIFCTTEADKIPITVLSRCQRFDFAPMELGSIIGRLEQICRTEGIEAEPEALQIIARRAAGSMRDSQSLLEQLLSFGGERIAAADVHAMLGTAQGGRLLAMAERLIARDAAGALADLDAAVNEGVDVGQFAEQLLGLYRDMAAAAIGCGPDMLLHTASADHARLVEAGRALGLETILAAVQILDQAVVRMKQTTQVRTLVEMALIRICRLEELDELSSLVAQLRQMPSGAAPPRGASTPPLRPAASPGRMSHSPSADSPNRGGGEKEIAAERNSDEGASAAQKKTPGGGEVTVEAASSRPLSLDEGRAVWQQAIAALEDSGDIAADLVKLASNVAISGPNALAVAFPAQYTYQKSACERLDRKARLEEAVSAAAGRTIRLEFRIDENATASRPVERTAPPVSTLVQKAQRKREKERHPLVRQAMELFEADVEHVTESAPRPEVEEADTAFASRDGD
jgi:DNA polymerase III subunit gamma/tau